MTDVNVDKDIVSTPYSGKYGLRKDDVELWLIEKVSEIIKIEPTEIDTSKPFKYYGLDSEAVVSITSSLGLWLNKRLPSTLGFDFPNIQALAKYLSNNHEGHDSSMVQCHDFRARCKTDNTAVPAFKDLLSRSMGQSDSIDNLSSVAEQNDIAIVGMACRFPGGSNTIEQFWDFLKSGKDAIREVPDDRWNIEDYFDENSEALGRMNTRWGGFLENIDQFDASFFGIFPREANSMDVQQRITLEVCWEALERAGEISEKLRASATGIFIGISGSDYGRRLFKDPTRLDLYSGTGNSTSIVANRVSYVLGLNGPSMAVDTACSSSLVSIHLACQSLISGESSMALAGGINLILSPEMTIIFSKAKLMAKDGRCKTFDAAADGYVRSEGCGIVVLKRLSDAIRDKNSILAVIKSTFINQDGESNGLTVPNGQAQQRLISGALEKANIAPSQVQYVETHGTGTIIGDPIEVRSLGEIYRKGRAEENPLTIGSVKTNIGHLEQAAGIAGIIKVVLSLQNELIPRNLHFNQLNPRIDLDRIPATIPLDGKPWPAGKEKRLAGVSGFSFGGVNAHVIIEEAPEIPLKNKRPDRSGHLFTISAQSEEALKNLAQRHLQHLIDHPDDSIHDICYTLNTGRKHLSHRLALVASSIEELSGELKRYLSGSNNSGFHTGRINNSIRPKLAFMFTGQGSQYVGMARELYCTSPIFQGVFDHCDSVLYDDLDISLKSLVFDEHTDGELLRQTRYTQPALFVLEYALAVLWQSWGIAPSHLVGHSVGEFVAACIAGVFSLDDALKLIAARGGLMQSLPQNGAMAVIFTSLDNVMSKIGALGDAVSIAAVNGPENITISGLAGQVEGTIKKFESDGINCFRLPVSHAFHSSLMKPIIQKYSKIAAEVTFHRPSIPIISNITGETAAADEICNPGYWCDHILKPVQFLKSINTLDKEGTQIFLEIGPSPVLKGLGRTCLPEKQVVWLHSIERNCGNWRILMENLANLYANGVEINWEQLDENSDGNRLVLPTYPFEHRRFWFQDMADERKTPSNTDFSKPFHPSHGNPVRTPHKDLIFEYRCTTDSVFLDHHRVYGYPVLPGAVFIAILIANTRKISGAKRLKLTETVFKEPLYVSEGSESIIQLLLTPVEKDIYHFRFFSTTDTDQPWKEHLTGSVTIAGMALNATEFMAPSIEKLQKRLAQSADIDLFYQTIYQSGLQLGRQYRWIDEIVFSEDEALARIRVPQADETFPESELHPGIIDACTQLLFAFASLKQDHTYMFLGYESFEFVEAIPQIMWCHLKKRSDDVSGKILTGSFTLFDSSGEMVARSSGVHLIQADRSILEQKFKGADTDIYYRLHWHKLDPAERNGTPVPSKAETTSGNRWIIFSDTDGIGTRLSEFMDLRGGDCVLVYPGTGYQKIIENQYVIDPSNIEDYQRLTRDVFKKSTNYRGIIHLWSLDINRDEEPLVQDPDSAQLLGCGSVLHLIRQLMEQENNPVLPVWLVTKGCQSVVGTEKNINPNQAPIWGLGRVIALEHSEFLGGLIDLDPDGTDHVRSILQVVQRESNNSFLAFRQGSFYIPLLRKDAPTVKFNKGIGLDTNASYLISGGLGAVGLLLATWLSSVGAKHLVLLGRKEISREAKGTIEKLQKAGTSVSIFYADVTDLNRLKDVFHLIEKELPPLKGVFHLAGELIDNALYNQNWNDFVRVMNPKMTGAWNLHQLTRDLNLTHFVMFSSVVSLLGMKGQANYAAANAFLDSFTHFRRSQGLTGKTINWGLWEDTGMAAALDVNGRQRWSDLGFKSICPDDSFAALNTILTSDVSQCAVFCVDWAQYGQRVPEQSQQVIPAAIARARADRHLIPAESRWGRQTDLEKSYEPAADESGLEKTGAKPDETETTDSEAKELGIRDQIHYLLRKTLWLDSKAFIDAEKSLTEMGLDSLMIIELRSQIKKNLGIDLPLTDFIRKSSINSLMRKIENQQHAGPSSKAETSSLPELIVSRDDLYKPFPLTDVQYAYWIGRNGQFELGDVSCHVYVEVDMTELDLERLNKAIDRLVDRHEMLRAVVLPDGWQKILKSVPPYRINELKLDRLTEEERQGALLALRNEMSHRVHDCQNGPLFEVCASILDRKKNRLHISFDLLVGDGWTFNILISDLHAYYKDPEIQLPPIQVSFRDYVIAEQSYRKSEQYQKSLNYWRERIENLPPAPQLPLRLQPEKLKQTRFTRYASRMEKKDWDNLRKKGGREGLTPSAILLAVFSVILGRWSKSPKFTIMLTLFNRLPLHEQVNSLVGDFTSLITLSVDTGKKQPFKNLALKIQEQLWADMEHRHVSGVQVLRELGKVKGRDSAITMPVVFTSVLPYSGTKSEETSMLGLQVDLPVDFVYCISQTPQVWLDFQIFEHNGALTFNWDVVEDLFPEGLLKDMFDSLCTLLSALVNNEHSWDRSDDICIPDYQLALQKQANQTDSPVSEALLQTLFLRQVKLHPDHEAVVTTNVRLTYSDLFFRASQISRTLHENKVGKNNIVAIVMEKGWEQVVAVLGILMSGASYLPIDPNSPAERLAFLLENAEVGCVLTQSYLMSECDFPDDLIYICPDGLHPEKETLPALDIDQSPEDLAYVIYTSGSTGVPKGVMINHQGAVNTIMDINRRFAVGPEDRIFAVSNLNFDLSVYDVLGGLAAGATVIIPDARGARDPAHWYSMVIKEKVTLWNSVPALMEMFTEYALGKRQSQEYDLRCILLSGDWIPLNLPPKIKTLLPSVEIVSLGGATEASIWSIAYPIETIDPDWTSIPYGKPLTNQRVYVLSEDFEVCPIWVPGQLYIGGIGLSLGYWKDRDKTDCSFVVNPNTGERIYKTGDFGRYLPDGNIEFLGREDSQVKIHGHRIELGEIEETIKTHNDIQDAIVVVNKGSNEDSFLSAYVVPKDHNGGLLYDTLENDPVGFGEHYDSCIQQTATAIQQNFGELDYDGFALFEQAADTLSRSLICETLETLGVFKEPGKFSISDLKNRCRLDSGYLHLVEQWLTVLVEADYLTITGDGEYLVGAIPVSNTLKTEADNLASKSGDAWNKCYAGINNFLSRISERLPDVLKGNQSPLELFFPQDLSLSPEILLQQTPAVKEISAVTREMVGLLSRQNGAGNPIRILEISARSGQTSHSLLKELSKADYIYTLTDDSRFFINRLKEKFETQPQVEYRILDMNRNPMEQGFDAHSFDLVIGAYSIHRAHHLDRTIEYMKSLLAPNGLLLLLEATHNSLIQQVSVALLEQGFLYFQDERAETSLPLLSAEEWGKRLLKNGLQEIRIFPDPQSRYTVFGRHLIVARAPVDIRVFQPDALKQFLKSKLPEYMIPNAIKALKQMPLTVNGKVDRKLLSSQPITLSPIRKKSATPRTDLEETLVKVWKAVFRLETISVEDNFFELGGDSLLGTQLITSIREKTGIEISLRILFQAGTIRSLGEYMASSSVGQQDKKRHVFPVITPDPEHKNEPFPLTDVQTAYWIGRTGIFELGNVSTHSYFEIEGRHLDLERLSEAWMRLVNHHDMMRAVILPNGQGQKILAGVPHYEFAITDLREKSPSVIEEALSALRRDRSHQVLSTDTWPLFDISITRLPDDLVRLHISFDNLIFDGWSMLHLFKEWARLYFSPEALLTPFDLSFRDYVLGLRSLEKTELYKADQEYWLSRINRLPPAPELPLAVNPGALANHRFRRLEYEMTSQVWEKLKTRLKSYNLTPSGLLLAAYAEILGLWSKSSCFCINLTLFNRIPVHPQVNDIVGDFTSLTLLEVDGKSADTFSDRALNIQKQLWQDLDHPLMGGIKVLREYARINRHDTKSAVMPVVFTSAVGLNSFEQDASGITQLGRLVYNITQTPQVWLDHQVYENAGNLILVWDFVEGLFPENMPEDMFQSYCNLLDALASDGSTWLRDTPSTLPAYQSEKRESVNRTHAHVSGECLHTLFEKQVQLQPDSPAIVTDQQTLTYYELHQKALAVAWLLREKKVGINTLVAIVMEKGWQQIVAALGILQSGAAYLPIDAKLPKERIDLLLEQGEVEIVLTQSKYIDEFDWPQAVESIAVDSIRQGASQRQPHQPIQSPEDLAYVIFTSGSTGTPKGVMIDHQGAVNTIVDINARFQVGPKDRVLALSNFNFDLSVYDTFGILAAGGALVLPDVSMLRDPGHWLKLLKHQKITIWNSVPALMQVLVEYASDRCEKFSPALRLILLSGDWIPLDLPGRIKELGPDIKTISLGGATEASIWSIYYPIESIASGWKSIPYGFPMINQKFHVLNELLQPSPVWVPGQLYISGIGLAKGYWRDQEKTRLSFIRHPKTKERLYRTGDIGRYLPDGSIEFLGREDAQIKIRGYRIELGEIESTIMDCTGVTNSVATVHRDQSGEQRIVGYVTTDPTIDTKPGTILAFLADRLPSYMIPAKIISLERIPLTANGKVDRNALPDPDFTGMGANSETIDPTNDLERLIMNTIKQVLEVTKFGIHDNLFDIGANSLHMMRIQSKLETVLHKEISVIHLFEHTTVSRLADFLGTGEALNPIITQARNQANRRKQRRIRTRLN